jgi:hypothetical protein
MYTTWRLRIPVQSPQSTITSGCKETMKVRNYFDLKDGLQYITKCSIVNDVIRHVRG